MPLPVKVSRAALVCVALLSGSVSGQDVEKPEARLFHSSFQIHFGRMRERMPRTTLGRALRSVEFEEAWAPFVDVVVESFDAGVLSEHPQVSESFERLWPALRKVDWIEIVVAGWDADDFCVFCRFGPLEDAEAVAADLRGQVPEDRLEEFDGVLTERDVDQRTILAQVRDQAVGFGVCAKGTRGLKGLVEVAFARPIPEESPMLKVQADLGALSLPIETVSFTADPFGSRVDTETTLQIVEEFAWMLDPLRTRKQVELHGAMPAGERYAMAGAIDPAATIRTVDRWMTSGGGSESLTSALEDLSKSAGFDLREALLKHLTGDLMWVDAFHRIDPMQIAARMEREESPVKPEELGIGLLLGYQDQEAFWLDFTRALQALDVRGFEVEDFEGVRIVSLRSVFEFVPLPEGLWIGFGDAIKPTTRRIIRGYLDEEARWDDWEKGLEEPLVVLGSNFALRSYTRGSGLGQMLVDIGRRIAGKMAQAPTPEEAGRRAAPASLEMLFGGVGGSVMGLGVTGRSLRLRKIF